MLRLDYPEKTVLVGNFSCYLTVEESHQWHDYIIAQPGYMLYTKSKLRLEMCTHIGQRDMEESISQLETEVDNYMRLEQALYALAEAWYAKLEHEDIKS